MCGVIFILLSYSFVVQTAAEHLGSRTALAWVACLFATSMWYNLFAPNMLPARRSSRRTRMLLTALNRALAPCAVLSVAFVCSMIARKHSARLAIIDAFLLILMEISTRYVVTSAAGGKRFGAARKVPAQRVESVDAPDEDNDGDYSVSIPRQVADRTRMLEVHSGRVQKPNQKTSERYSYGRTSKREVIVMIEGPICAGKTTLCKDGVHYLTREIRIVPEDVHASLHAAFVNKPAAYGFTLQMVMRERRDAALALASERCQLRTSDHVEQCIVALDRSVLGDFAFLVWNYIEGAITHEQFEVYCRQYGDTPAKSLTLQPFTQYSIAVVFAGSRVCRERLLHRPGVDQGTPLRYLQGLEIAHAMCAANVIRERKDIAVHLLSGREQRSTVVDYIKLVGKLTKKTHTCEDIEFEEEVDDEPFAFANAGEAERYEAVCGHLKLRGLVPTDAVCEKKWRAALMAEI